MTDSVWHGGREYHYDPDREALAREKATSASLRALLAESRERHGRLLADHARLVAELRATRSHLADLKAEGEARHADRSRDYDQLLSAVREFLRWKQGSIERKRALAHLKTFAH